MLTALDFMFTPFIACILLLGITVYFGIHVIKREIIFIDISLAQIAALGGVVSLIIQKSYGTEGQIHDHGSHTMLSYIFCILAAIIFALLKNKKVKIPLEAIIGVSYAVATTGTVIILDKGAGGDVHIHDMLAGTILWVTWHQIFRLFINVAIIGGFHFIFRKKFFRLTDNYLENKDSIKNPILWDFLFYFTFGIVIVEAVSVGGIITVFAFLIIPASISAFFADSWFSRILIGLCVGSLVTILGLYLSWVMDIPCSPTIILFLGVFLLIALGLKALKLIGK